ncbi:hypothetical protein [Thalassovita mediterranea]|uniref:hypothetical protein n=1 Tax=Thalassovita mediterranea TaxID=340021 RepID=UPI00071D412B|nr:hypothetical protein [Thalassovita mediterranea]
MVEVVGVVVVADLAVVRAAAAVAADTKQQVLVRAADRVAAIMAVGPVPVAVVPVAVLAAVPVVAVQFRVAQAAVAAAAR